MSNFSLLRNHRWLWGFAGVFAFLCISLLVLEYTNRDYGGIWLRDFQVFHRAGGRILSGDILFQPARDGYYSFKYSPTSAVLFIPISLLPFRAAEVIYWLFVSGLVVVGFYLSLAVVYPDFRNAEPRRLALVLALAGAILGVHIWSELTLGQVNHLLLVLYIAIAYLFTRNRPVLLAFIWSLSIFIKPFGLILVPYFILKRRFRELAYFLGFTLLFFCLPVLFFGGNFLAGQRTWYSEMLFELHNKSDVFQPGNQTLVSVLARYGSLDALSPGPLQLTIYKIVVISLAAVLTLLLIRRGSRVQRPEPLEFAFLLALTPLLSYTNSYAFGFVELAVFLLLINFGKMRIWEKALAACGFLLIGGNFFNQLSYDWGDRLYQYFDSLSLVGIGAILLLASIVSARWRAVC